MKFRVYSLVGRKILAVPDDRRKFRLAAWNRFQPVTFKRTLVQRAMQLAILLGMDGLFCKFHRTPFGDDDHFAFQGWLEQVRQEIGLPSVLPVIVWPPQQDRGRVYVHLLNKNGRPTGFCKVSFDEKNDGNLSNELHALRVFEKRQLNTCCMPKVLAEGVWKNHVYLLEEPIPVGTRSVSTTEDAYPRLCIDEISGRTRLIDHKNVKAFAWLQSFDKLSDSVTCNYFNELTKLIGKTGCLPVHRVHGDLRPENMTLAGGKLWIFDWEVSSELGPILTDEIGYDLAIHAKALKKDQKKECRRFFNRHLQGASLEKRRDIMAALAFRHAYAPLTTQPYIQRWNNNTSIGI